MHEDVRNKAARSTSILPLIHDVIYEKRVQQNGLTPIKITSSFKEDAFFLFSNVNAAEFKRSLSNVIESALEAEKAFQINCELNK